MLLLISPVLTNVNYTKQTWTLYIIQFGTSRKNLYMRGDSNHMQTYMNSAVRGLNGDYGVNILCYLIYYNATNSVFFCAFIHDRLYLLHVHATAELSIPHPSSPSASRPHFFFFYKLTTEQY